MSKKFPIKQFIQRNPITIVKIVGALGLGIAACLMQVDVSPFTKFTEYVNAFLTSTVNGKPYNFWTNLLIPCVFYLIAGFLLVTLFFESLTSHDDGRYDYDREYDDALIRITLPILLVLLFFLLVWLGVGLILLWGTGLLIGYSLTFLFQNTDYRKGH